MSVRRNSRDTLLYVSGQACVYYLQNVKTKPLLRFFLGVLLVQICTNLVPNLVSAVIVISGIIFLHQTCTKSAPNFPFYGTKLFPYLDQNRYPTTRSYLRIWSKLGPTLFQVWGTLIVDGTVVLRLFCSLVSQLIRAVYLGDNPLIT